MVKKCSTLCSTDQIFIQKRNTNYRIHTLEADLFVLSFRQKANFERISLILDCMICYWSKGQTFAEKRIKLSTPSFILLFDSIVFSYIHRNIFFGRIANLFLFFGVNHILCKNYDWKTKLFFQFCTAYFFLRYIAQFFTQIYMNCFVSS